MDICLGNYDGRFLKFEGLEQKYAFKIDTFSTHFHCFFSICGALLCGNFDVSWQLVPELHVNGSVSIQRTIVERYSIKHVLDRETAESHGKP